MYTLSLYTSAFAGTPEFLTKFDVSDNIGWERSIKLNGGYYEGGFELAGEEWRTVIENLFWVWEHVHVVETVNGITTWEGFVDDLEFEPDTPRLAVTARGYIFTFTDRYVTGGDGSTDSASDWIADVISGACPMVASTNISTNNTSVIRNNEDKLRPIDEINKIVEIGDTSGNPWRYYMSAGRQFVYEQISTSPVGYVDGGMTLRKSRSDVYNYIQVEYQDNNATETTAAASDTESVNRYERRHLIQPSQNLGLIPAAAFRDTLLSESAYPYARPVGAAAIQVFLGSGEPVAFDPWFAKPGVYQDRRGAIWEAKFPSTAWLTDKRDFLVDEVHVNANGELSLRTEYYRESDLLELREQMAVDVTAYWNNYRSGIRTTTLDFGEIRDTPNPEWNWRTGRY